MKYSLPTYLVLFILLAVNTVTAQENQTIFKGGDLKRSGGYGALSNKFTTINGSYANMPEVYGGWFINRRLMIGVAAAATTNRIPVPIENQYGTGESLSYQYGQFGLMTEFVTASTKRVHINFNLMTGAGFILQYDRSNWDHWEFEDDAHDPDCFFVMEPGLQLELNLFRWMRFSPGVSYRRAFGSNSKGLTDDELSGVSGNLTLKFGRF